MFDVHCHIIPGVDDGSRNMNESLAMLKEARASGIDRIVCTSHCRSSHFNRQLIIKRFNELAPYAKRMNIQLDLGFEVHCEKLIDLGLECAPSLCFDGTNLLLLEFSCPSLPVQWQRIIYNLQGMGIRLIIAHPERYRPVQNDLDIAYEMKELGCLLQLSGNFVEGNMFDARRKTAIALLKNNLVDYIASDAHRPQDYENYRKALQVAQKYA